MIGRFLGTFFGDQRVSYRRLLVFLTSTVALPFGLIEGSDWCMLCIAYIASDSGAKAIASWRGAA